jgi:tRNA(Ile2) C34 agmatinyltransferase TiaS
MISMKNCCICGKEINAKGKTKYCPECRKEHRKEYISNYHRLTREHLSIYAGDYALLARYAKENNLKLIEAFHKIMLDVSIRV